MVSLAQDRAADEQNIKQPVHVHGDWTTLSQLMKTALIDLRKQCLDNYKTLLHVKLNDAGEKISAYFGAAINGYNSQVLEGVCPGLGQWAETIVNGVGLEARKVVKLMVYDTGRGLFLLHNDEPHVLNKFRVSISFSPEMPNFAMRFKNTKNVFEIQRGPLALVVMNMHAAQAGRTAEDNGD
jgi:hypothetical protein